MSCLAEPEIYLDTWANRMLAPLGRARYPLSASIELTERCNLDCVHCYISQPAASEAAKAREMTTAQVKSVLDQMAQAGTLFLLITGGEAMLRPDFTEIYQHAKRLGFIITLFTNGTTVTPQLADMLAKAPPTLIEVTLDGATAETFEAVTRLPGSFAQCLRGIKLLRERGLVVLVKTVLLTLNQNELQGIRSLAAELSLNHRYDSTIWPRLDGNPAPYRYRLSPEKTLAMDLADPERAAEWVVNSERNAGIPVRNGLTFTCGGGHRSYHVDSAGRLTVCMMVREPSYSLLEMPFAEAWERLGAVRNMHRSKATRCETCAANDLCAQCTGWSQLSNKDNETPDDFVCTVGKLRMKQFGIKVLEPVMEGSNE